MLPATTFMEKNGVDGGHITAELKESAGFVTLYDGMSIQEHQMPAWASEPTERPAEPHQRNTLDNSKGECGPESGVLPLRERSKDTVHAGETRVLRIWQRPVLRSRIDSIHGLGHLENHSASCRYCCEHAGCWLCQTPSEQGFGPLSVPILVEAAYLSR
ncbi:hypothetical protein LY76DRAFT_420855 [Colletotrichum caudatum]|nr:hypothetical protein LY76DRAFT_420855 [Colletotrichum caudatum]